MGLAEDWQSRLTKELSNLDIVLLNPRRTSWDSSWVQSINNPIFKEQVDWELDALDRATVVVFYFDPNTKSPITLMELGLQASWHNNGKQVIVCCPDGFWRKGNVEIVCDRFGIPVYNTYNDLVTNLKKSLTNT